MSDHERAFRLNLFRPPYTHLDEPYAHPQVEMPPKGIFMVWRPIKSGGLVDAKETMQSRPLGVDLVVVLPPPTNIPCLADVLDILPQVHPLYVVPASVGDARRLRQLLRQPPESLAASLTEYLWRRGLLQEERTADEIECLISAVPHVRSVTALAKRLCSSRRTLGRHFASSGIPSPSHWLQLVRLLHVVLGMQRRQMPLARACSQVGYPDPFTCSNQMKRLTGLRPSEVKSRLGWHWFVECWVREEAARGGFDERRYYSALAQYLENSAGAIAD